MKPWAKQKGFTIVELLIVIVVVGILAAITIVAYNGIQTRTENTKTVQAVGQYVKTLHSYGALKGNYPVEVAYPCLGPSGTQCARRSGTASTCTASQGDGPTSAGATFESNLREVLSGPLPQLSSQVLSCGGNTYSGGYYRPTTGATAQVVYYLRGDEPCSGIGGVQSLTKTQQEEITRCIATLPPLQ